MYQFIYDESGVTPVVGVIVVVAVTVILSASIGTLLLDLEYRNANGDDTNTLGVRSSVSSTGVLTVTVVVGTADTVELNVNGSVQDKSTNVRPGTELLATGITPDSEIFITETTNNQTTLVSTNNPID